MFSKIIFFLIALLSASYSQVVATDPPFATRLDSFSVIFDASLGNGGLAGYPGDDVYAHTGVTIEGVGTWQYVNAGWTDNLPHRRLTRIEVDLWRLNVGNPYEYYGVPQGQVITQLSFVFKNSDQSVTGRDVGAADIFLDLYEPGVTVNVQQPAVDVRFGDPQRSPVFINPADTLEIFAVGVAIGTRITSMELFVDEQSLVSVQNDTLEYSYYPYTASGIKVLKLVATDTSGINDSTEFAVMVVPEIVEETRPEGIEDGINYVNDNTVILSLMAPYKEHVFAIGDFNNWLVHESFSMKKDMVSEDEVHWWLELDDLSPGSKYAMQYLVDGEIRIADPYSEIILDPYDDQYISDQTYPDLKPYPAGMTDFGVTLLEPGADEYEWQNTDFQPPAMEELVIYELLIRDFLAAHDFNTLADTLDYLVNLGVNAVELMPVSEFEGNISWGYNPSFHMALDKYYGPKDDLKRLVDACHERGLAVILDMVLNHAFGQSPLVRLYASGDYGPPTGENPWLNITATHPDNVGYDFNHESVYTQRFVDKVNRYWIEEFNIDGYRFDLAKGFMQTGSYEGYNAGRIILIKRMADEIREYKADTYIILENWAANDERSELADYGMMIWGHPNPDKNLGYYEATMGYHDENKSDFSWGYYGTRGWSQPHLVTKIESHDEERLMYKNLTWGNGSGDYSVKDLSTALHRMKAALSFFFTIPGPKMFWQFMELGYDVSIFSDSNGNVPQPYGDDSYKLDRKPIRWNYFQDPDRRRLYDTFAALLEMRKENPVFRSAETTVNLSVTGSNKRIKLSHPTMDVTIIGNFGVTASQMNPAFHGTGIWYDFFSGDSIFVSDANATISLQPGEFHIYSTVKLNSPVVDPVSVIEKESVLHPVSFSLNQNYPNPFNPFTRINYQLPANGRVILKIYDVAGREIKTLLDQYQSAGIHSAAFNASGLSSGIYFYTLKTANHLQTKKMLLIK